MSDKSEKIRNLKPGELLTIGKKIYSVCARCKSLVRVNKFLFGSLHVCE